MKTIFIPCYSTIDPIPVVKRALRLMKDYKRIGLVATIQHTNKLERVGEFLEKHGKNATLGGKILGCNIENARKIERRVDCFLYIGSGRFHPMGLAINTDRPVFIANPISGLVEKISEKEGKRYIKRRKGQILRTMEAKIFGIIVSTKEGQFNLESAYNIKEMIEKSGRRAFIFSGQEITPDRLLGFEVDAWVNTACPRLCDDHFDKPVLNPDELSIILQE